MKKSIIKGIKIFALGFFLLFFLRLVYGYLSYPVNQNNQVRMDRVGNTFSGFSGRNYASKKIIRKGNSVQAPLSVDQKYEKVASIGATTKAFEEDEKQVRSIIEEFNALIQFEQQSGLSGNRYLHLAIGVDPNKFEDMTQSLSGIGKMISFRVDKSDKTSEYKNLQAKKASLEKNLRNLSELKTRGGNLEDLVNLETRILEIEEKIQGLGIDLGEFDEENEFCTIKYTLEERQVRTTNISIAQRLKVAFEWTVEYYLLLVGMVLMASIASLVIVTVIRLVSPFVEKHLK